MSKFTGTANFTPAEVACKCGCGLLPSQAFMEKVQRARNRTNFKWPVTSGARCPEYNVIVSDTGDSGPHTKDAIDIGVSGAQARAVLAAFLAEGFSGIGVNQRGPHNKRFIHGDDLPNEDGQPRPHVWSY
jgi:hypothetical protein